MIDPVVRFPVVCPRCGSEKLTEFPVNDVAYVLSRGLDFSLVATCHETIWTATELELEQIHQYLLVLTEAATLGGPIHLRNHCSATPSFLNTATDTPRLRATFSKI